MSVDEAQAPITAQDVADRVFVELHALILSHEDGARSGDLESIHDMRVSIRRLRVALSNFSACISKENRQWLRMRLENLAEALGQVRDLDVMVESLTQQLPDRTPLDRKSLEALIHRLRKRRRTRLRGLRRYLDGTEYAEFKVKGLHSAEAVQPTKGLLKEQTIGEGI